MSEELPVDETLVLSPQQYAVYVQKVDPDEDPLGALRDLVGTKVDEWLETLEDELSNEEDPSPDEEIERLATDLWKKVRRAFPNIALCSIEYAIDLTILPTIEGETTYLGQTHQWVADRRIELTGDLRRVYTLPSGEVREIKRLIKPVFISHAFHQVRLI
jgi:hypothetical protein